VALTLAVALFVGVLLLYGLLPPVAPAVGGDLALARSDRAGLRVLFVGNSFTFGNDMPGMLHELAAADAAAAPIYAVAYVAPGWSLKGASENEGLSALLREVRWDVVVLQERSWLPSSSLWKRQRETLPYARILDRRIERAAARTLLFMTWGYEHGDPAYASNDTFAAMQDRLETGYTHLADELSALVAPVGLAWAEALGQRPGLRLWARDGRHPSRLGSYLTACVFYAVLSGRDPRESAFTAGLPNHEAAFLRRVAAGVVASRRAP
jgi:hypothetical protein